MPKFEEIPVKKPRKINSPKKLDLEKIKKPRKKKAPEIPSESLNVEKIKKPRKKKTPEIPPSEPSNLNTKIPEFNQNLDPYFATFSSTITTGVESVLKNHLEKQDKKFFNYIRSLEKKKKEKSIDNSDQEIEETTHKIPEQNNTPQVPIQSDTPQISIENNTPQIPIEPSKQKDDQPFKQNRASTQILIPSSINQRTKNHPFYEQRVRYHNIIMP